MTPARRPGLLFGLAMVGLGILILAAVGNSFLRYAGGLTALAIGLGAIRRALRIE
jgi:hypothetical protein